MKLTPADKWFSKAVRERNNWTCEKCGTVSSEGQATGGDRAIQCSHFIGRQHKATRYHSSNGFCLCASCHAHVETDPYLHVELVRPIIGEGMVEILSQLKRMAYKPVGGWKAYEKEAAKHYQNEFNRLRGLRADGEMGRIEIAGFE